MLAAGRTGSSTEKQGRLGRENEANPRGDDALLEPHEAQAVKEFFDKYPAEIQAAITKPPAERTPFEWQMYYKAKPYLEHRRDDAGEAAEGRRQEEVRGAESRNWRKFDALKPGEPPIGIGHARHQRQGARNASC